VCSSDLSYDGDTEINWWVEDILGNSLNVSGSTTVSIMPLYTWTSIETMTIPTSAPDGTYYLRTSAYAAGYSAIAHCSFIVSTPTATQSPAYGGPTGMPPVTNITNVTNIVPSVTNIEIFYPQTIIAFLNETKNIYIQVKNSDIQTLHKLQLILQGIELDWFSIKPTSANLDPGAIREFEIELKIPSEAATKKYPMKLLVKSDEFERTLDLSLNVLQIYNRTELESKIAELGQNVKSLENQLKNLNKTGVDITAIQQLLTLSEQKLNEAEQFLQTDDYSKATQLVYEVENTLIVIQNALKARPLELPLNTLFIIFSAIIAISIVALYFGKIKLNLKEFLGKPKVFEKIRKVFKSKKCSNCKTKMQEIYRNGRLIGYRCPKCKTIKYEEKFISTNILLF
jgi:hypothetical protein